MKKSKLLLFCIIIIAISSFFLLDLQQYLTIDFFSSQQAAIQDFVDTHPARSGLYFFCTYIVVTSLSLPGAGIMTLISGALFGILWGSIVVALAAPVGASIAFLSSRFIFREYIQNKFASKLVTINKGIEKDGALYLFTLRLIPIFPFFIINLVMGLTPIRLVTFFFVSMIGMLPATVVFVNAGTQIAKISSPGDILSPGLIFAFALLGIFPLLTKKFIYHLNAYKVYKRFNKPSKFDRNLVVIGAGSAGLVTAYIAATVKAKVTLIEKHKMGGDCLNTGCVPSKALIRTAKFLANTRRAEQYGIKSAKVEFEFSEVMERVQRIIKIIEPHDSIERYTKLGVECIEGEATISSPWSVQVNNRILTTRNIVIATGARPFVPPIKGIDQVNYFTSDTIWSLRTLPDRLVILGGGPIGCELTQCFARFGSHVTQVEMLPRLLIREDAEVSELIQEKFKSENIDVRLNHKAKEIISNSDDHTLICESGDKETEIGFDAILVAVGRKANTEGVGLEQMNIPLTEQGNIQVNEYLQTVYPNIFACGDVAGPYQFTHTASHQAWYTAVNSLFGRFKKFRIDYSVIPWATFTDPEVARVGLNEQEAREKNIAFEITTYGIDDLDRAITDEEAHGFVKILTVPGKDRILGVTIVGEHAGDLITEFISAMKNNIGLNKILGTIHIYPTLAEANKFAAGNWKKNHAPEKILHWVEKFHSWQRK